MHVVITGAAGFIGKKLTRALLQREALPGAGGEPEKISRLTLLDIAAPDAGPSGDIAVRSMGGDIGDGEIMREALGADAAVIFHLAAVVSGQAEADFDLGMRVNLDGTRGLLEACRGLETPPRLFFPSSVAVFGGEMPDAVSDDTPPRPQTSYGAQKAICETMINDFSRKGYVDGRVARLPTIAIRPGKPNQAASTFASSILREPLQGQTAVCPVPRETGIWIMSPRRAIDAILHAVELPPEKWGWNRVLNLAGLTVTVEEMLAAMERAAGPEALKLVRWEPNAEITRIITGWPARFNSERALQLGFRADADMDAVVRTFLEDDRVNPEPA